MDIPKMVAEPERVAEQEEQPGEGEEYEEGIMIRASDLLHFQEGTPSWTYDLRFQIYRGMLVRTSSRSKRCSEPSWTDCHQQQDIPHHHQPRDVFVTSWFIFHSPLHCICIFFIRTLWAVRVLSLGVFYCVVRFLLFIMHFILIMVYFSFVSLIL
jgi:hypothetical protein